MKKILIGALILILVAVTALLMADNKKENKNQVEEQKGDIILYYISVKGNALHKVPYRFTKKGRTKESAQEVLEQLQTVPMDEECQTPIPSSVTWSDVTIEDGNLVIDFTSSYSKLSFLQEVLLRACVVKSLVQIEGVNTVEFRQNGTPLMTIDDQPIGPMTSDRFIDDSNANWGGTQDDELTLFYANEQGDHLKSIDRKITVDNNVPMEQVIIERLMEDPEEEGYYSPIPKGTKVLKTITKNGTCYVDFDENFLNPMEHVSPTVTIYAVVNSLVELPNVNKVQFTINGEKVKKFRESLKFDVSFDRNLDLME